MQYNAPVRPVESTSSGGLPAGPGVPGIRRSFGSTPNGPSVIWTVPASLISIGFRPVGPGMVTARDQVKPSSGMPQDGRRRDDAALQQTETESSEAKQRRGGQEKSGHAQGSGAGLQGDSGREHGGEQRADRC
eukprot:SAG22_NODE_1788_length_3571_cov_3.315956_3_plen_133_part_00